jgi:hypothetical protein
MSIVKVQGNASGTGEFILTSPNSNTNRTITLPDATGTLDRTNRAGNVLQVVSTTKVDAFTTTSTSAVDVTGLSVNITPSRATSKILVLAQIFGGGDVSTAIYINLVRNSTNLSISTVSSGGLNSTVGAYVGSGSNYTTSPIVFLDSPATTSSTTYKIQLFVSAGTAAVNRRASDTVVGGTSSITVMEIAA